MAGIGPTRTIIMSDNMIEEMNKDEIIATVNHELGHVYYHHTLLNGFVIIVYISMFLLLFSQLYREKEVIGSFGFKYQSDCVYVFVFYLLCSPLHFACSIILNTISRTVEYQADAFAVSHGHTDNLKKALISMSIKGK